MSKKLETKAAEAAGVRFSLTEEGKEVARVYLYLMHNDLHEHPFGLMEDVWVSEEMRGQGHGTEIVQELVRYAREHNCYKLIATSRHARPKVHALYERLGFTQHGLEFRIDF